MRIALLSFEYPPETGFGGIGTYTWNQARALTKLGHEVHVLAGSLTAANELQSKDDDGVRVWRFRSDSFPVRALGLLDRRGLWWTRLRLQNAVSMYRGFAQLKRRYAFDLVEMPECGGEGLMINHLSRVASVVRFHGPARLVMGDYDVSRADHVLCSWAEQIGISGAGHFSAPSRFLADAVRDQMGLRRAIQLIPNGIDIEWADAAPQIDIRRACDLPRDKPIIVFAGRMERRKGIHLMPEIAASILARHDVALVFAGQDLFRYMADTLLPFLSGKRLRGSVHYLGQLDLAYARSCICQSDVVLMPSLWENCPYVCLEAMAAGRAIVSSDCGGMPELIHHEVNGLLARSGDGPAFIAQLERLIEDRLLRERMGAAARKTVEQSFTDLEMGRRSAEWYEGCLRS